MNIMTEAYAKAHDLGCRNVDTRFLPIAWALDMKEKDAREFRDWLIANDFAIVELHDPINSTPPLGWDVRFSAEAL